MKRQLLIALSTFTLLLLCAALGAAQVVVNPGERKEFSRADDCGGIANCSAVKFTGDFNEGNVKYAIKESANLLLAQAKSSGVAGSAAVAVQIYNIFSVSGSIPRTLDAQVSATVQWKGEISETLDGSGHVNLYLALLDLTAGQKELERKTILDSGDEKKYQGSDSFSFSAKVVRGHAYAIVFHLETSASTGIAGKANTDFSSLADDGTPDRLARWTQLSVQVAGDIFDLLETLDNKVDNLAARLNTLQAGVNTANTRLDTLQTSVNTANARLTSVESKVDIANNTINAVNGKVDAVNNKLDARLDVAVSTRASQASVDALTGKVDDLAVALEAFKKLSQRAEIEAALVEGDRYNVALYQVPEAAGGYLELVRSIVADSIESCRKAGLNNNALGQAQGALASGDQYFAAKGFKDAYDQYRAAYLYLSIVPGDHRP